MSDKVFFLLSDLGFGGTARATTLVVNGLAAAGSDVTMVVVRRGGHHESMLDRRIRLISLDTGAARGPGMLLALPRLVRLLRQERPAKLVSAGNHMHVLASTAHRFARIPETELILKMTNPVERPNKSVLANKLRGAWYARAFRRATRILLIDDSARGELADSLDAPADKLVVVDNPYITDAMVAAGQADREPEPGLLLAIGRLVPQKNYPLMLSALARLPDVPWSLDILGDGPLRTKLEGQARDLGIADRVRFRGYVPDPVPYLRHSAALLLTSRWEGQGAVLLEAMASRCPVIATRSSAAVEAVVGGGRYGRLTAADAVQPFADAVRAELESPLKVEGASEWVERYRVGSGVQSHARALGLDLRAKSNPG